MAEGYYQPKESTSSSGQLDSSIVSGQRRFVGEYIGGGLPNAVQWRGVQLCSYQWWGSPNHFPCWGGDYPIPANKPQELTATLSPNAHPQASPPTENWGALRPLGHHLQEARSKVNIHRAPLAQQPRVPPTERKRKCAGNVTSGTTLRTQNGGSEVPC